MSEKNSMNWDFFKSKIESKRTEYNSTPVGLTVIDKQEFMRNIFHYCFAPQDSRQVCDGNNFRLVLFPLAYTNEKEKGLGYGLLWDVLGKFGNKDEYYYVRTGLQEDWEIFTKRFVSQFQGDNS